MRQTIGAGACDPSGCLSLVGALTLIEDAVTAAMAKLELDGLTVRRKYGALMVFSKNHFKFLQDINWQDEVTAACFFSMKSAARLNMDVCVKKDGKIAMYARTEICAIDAETGRIRRMDTIDTKQRIQVVKAPCDLPWNAMDGDGSLLAKVQVRTSNIDYAGHTNNVEYVRLLLDTMSLEEWRHMAPKELQVVYQNQSFLGDNLEIYACDHTIEEQHERLYTIKKAAQTVLCCAVRW